MNGEKRKQRKGRGRAEGNPEKIREHDTFLIHIHEELSCASW
jgi:hypothetical protein